jgi:hypothetical protein
MTARWWLMLALVVAVDAAIFVVAALTWPTGRLI